MKLLTTRYFHDVEVDFYVDEQDSTDFWITREQIGRMLRYRIPQYSIRNIHDIIDNRLVHSFREVKVNIREGLRITTLYNFNGLLEICKFSHKRQAKDAINFLWEVKRDFEQGQNLPVPISTTREFQMFNYSGNQMRIIEKNNEFWFVAKDVCDILELTNPTEALKSLDDDEKNTLRISEVIQNQRGNPNFNVINESGLYTLIMRSNKPEAKRFRKWVTGTVLPELIRTGAYNVRKAKLILTGKANETKFYSADEIGSELGMSDIEVVNLARENDLLMYGFSRDFNWYFTEEGYAKILNAARF